MTTTTWNTATFPESGNPNSAQINASGSGCTTSKTFSLKATFMTSANISVTN